jgi:GTP cyclohydrolase I
MNNHVHLSHEDVAHLARQIAYQIGVLAPSFDARPVLVYPIPRGGIPTWYAVQAALLKYERTRALQFTIAEDMRLTDIFIDDIIDSGRTKAAHLKHNGSAYFFALIDKAAGEYPNEWIVFPWEGTVQASADDIFIRLLQFVGEDVTRQGLQDTPERMARAWQHWCSGYKTDPTSVLKMFEDGAELYDEMIHTTNIPFYSHCEHHMAPFFGTVTFAYIPNKRIVGLSKMNRLVDVFARRLQVQERMTNQILKAFVDYVAPLGAACVVHGRHMCVESRGVQHQGCITTTSAIYGVFKEQPAVRAEFFALTNGR